MDRVRLAVAAIVVTPVCLGPIVFIGRQPRDPHHLGFQPFGPRCVALPRKSMAEPTRTTPIEEPTEMRTYVKDIATVEVALLGVTFGFYFSQRRLGGG